MQLIGLILLLTMIWALWLMLTSVWGRITNISKRSSTRTTTQTRTSSRYEYTDNSVRDSFNSKVEHHYHYHLPPAGHTSQQMPFFDSLRTLDDPQAEQHALQTTVFDSLFLPIVKTPDPLPSLEQPPVNASYRLPDPSNAIPLVRKKRIP